MKKISLSSTNHPNRRTVGWHRITAISTVLVLSILCLCGIASAAETTVIEIDDLLVSSDSYTTSQTHTTTDRGFRNIHMSPDYSISSGTRLAIIWFGSVGNNNASLHSGHIPIILTKDMSSYTPYATGTLSYYRNAAGKGWVSADVTFVNAVTGTERLFIIDGNTGNQYASLDGIYNNNAGTVPTGPTSINAPMGFAYSTTSSSRIFVGPYTLNKYVDFKHRISVEEIDDDTDAITVTRVINSIWYKSATKISGASGAYYDATGQNDVIQVVGRPDRPYRVDIDSLMGKNYTYEFFTGIDTPTTPAATTVYILNSQTGAAIANSRCVIDALVDGDYYPVVNRTEPSGIFSVSLQPTGGGMPNPDGYRLIASADGYINQIPEINFTVDEYTTSIYCSLDPIAGGPLDENNTFIDFFVRDMSANPIKGATVNFGGYTLITNSAGYAVLEVSKNVTYTYTVSKSGYGSLTGNVVIGADPRHTINTVLAPVVTPTTPTTIPTSTSIIPTPTMTAPTGEPTSNLLEWFAAHFGMILGGGVEIGKIFMWLCFAVPVGVYVGKEAKAGASGFMAGAGVVTLFFVLIGWVPIWLLVLLALIIGLLYSKAFNNSDNGGGR